MKPYHLLSILALLAFFMACGKGEVQPYQLDDDMAASSYVAVGDSMIYGLACDGCSDTVLVLLPDSGGDPVNYDIIDAMRNRQVFGRPSIGDKMAVMVDSLDPHKLVLVVDLEKVKGTWYYMELPQLRHRLLTRDSTAPRPVISKEESERRDSVIKTWMVPREYVYTLKRDFTVVTSGGPPRNSSLDDKSRVVYPSIKRYAEWHLHNGKIIFSYGGLPVSGNRDTLALVNDTAEFVMLRRDTMALRFNGEVRGFKLKPDTIQ